MFEVFKKLSKREMRLMIIAITIIFIYFIYAVIFVPSMERRDEVNSELSRLKQQEAQLNREVSNFNQLKEDYQNYIFDELLVQLPDEGKVPEIILWLQDIFQDPELSNPSIGFSMGEDVEQYLQITLSFSGPFLNVHRLINRIEANERVTTVDRVNLSRGAFNSLTANLVIRLYGQDFTDISENVYNFNKIDLFRVE